MIQLTHTFLWFGEFNHSYRYTTRNTKVAELSLKELKAENAGTEEVKEDVKVDDTQEVNKDEYVEVDKSGAEVKEESESTEDGEDDKPEIESWMQTEEAETSDNEKKGGFQPNAEAASRRKQNKALRGELGDAKDENTKLLERISALEAGNAPQEQKQTELEPRPTREDFDFDDDAYDAAVDKWNDEKLELKLNTHYKTNQDKNQQAQQQQAQQALMTKNLDSHYEKAQKLVDEGKITEESFRNSDTVVRRSMENVFKGKGNQMTDALISTLNTLGDGSEKVMYQLGVNPVKMQELSTLLTNDPSGLTAMGFLGQLQANITSPNKRSSQAPNPGSKVEGESGNGGKAGIAHKAYDKSTDLQTRISMKRKAKKEGIDTSKW